MADGHYAEIKKAEGVFRAELNGQVLAESSNVLELQEHHPSYEFAPVYYFPEESVNFDLLRAAEHRTHCPIKGDASYWNLEKDDGSVENLVWGYPSPLDSAAELRGTFAFDQGKKAQIFRNGEEIKKWGIKKK
jgi:uncharacterized protein (DUF427 family)